MAARLRIWLGSAVLLAGLTHSAAAQEYSNGGACASGRKEATLTPVEAFGVHPPGIDPADANRLIPRFRRQFVPYYAPRSPVATSARWEPWHYFPLLPYYTPYHLGYCPHRLFNPEPRPYGSDGWGKGPMPDASIPTTPGTTPLGYSAYTSVLWDETTFWNMGGNGLVPYGAPRARHGGGPDLVDAIQMSRQRGGVRLPPPGFMQKPAPAVVPPAEAIGEMPPAIPVEPDANGPRLDPPAEPIFPGRLPAEGQ